MSENLIVTLDENGKQYSNESLLKGLRRHTNFDGGRDPLGKGSGHIGSGIRAEVIKALGFSDHPTAAECSAMMKTFTINAYPNIKATLHKDLESEVQSIYNDLKALGVALNNSQGFYCFRTINNPNRPGSKVLSMHSFGCAIDLNYNLNPFVSKAGPLANGDDTPHGIVRTVNSPIVKVFAKYGWGWGGRYGDYMHFSKANGG